MTTDDAYDILPAPEQASLTAQRNEAGQWIKGVSGNPAGRAPGTGSIVVEIRRALQEERDGEPLAATIARRLVEMAADGDLRAIRDVIDRIDGTPNRDSTVTRDEVYIIHPIVL